VSEEHINQCSNAKPYYLYKPTILQKDIGTIPENPFLLPCPHGLYIPALGSSLSSLDIRYSI